jgi:hypothetical protein
MQSRRSQRAGRRSPCSPPCSRQQAAAAAAGQQGGQVGRQACASARLPTAATAGRSSTAAPQHQPPLARPSSRQGARWQPSGSPCYSPGRRTATIPPNLPGSRARRRQQQQHWVPGAHAPALAVEGGAVVLVERCAQDEALQQVGVGQPPAAVAHHVAGARGQRLGAGIAVEAAGHDEGALVGLPAGRGRQARVRVINGGRGQARGGVGRWSGSACFALRGPLERRCNRGVLCLWRGPSQAVGRRSRSPAASASAGAPRNVPKGNQAIGDASNVVVAQHARLHLGRGGGGGDGWQARVSGVGRAERLHVQHNAGQEQQRAAAGNIWRAGTLQHPEPAPVAAAAAAQAAAAPPTMWTYASSNALSFSAR